MDNFYLESLEKFIRRYKRNIVNKLENIQLTEKEMRNQSDLLCMVLDYSPRQLEEKKLYGIYIFNIKEKFRFKTSPISSPLNDKNISLRSLNLEYKQSSNDEESSEESRDGTIRFSKFSNKIKMESQKSGEMELIIKPLVYNIINRAFEQIEKNHKESSEEEDEYIKQIEQRRMKNDDTQNKISSIVNNAISNSKLSNKFIETYKLRIYLLNSQSYLDIAVALNETIRDIKGKILTHLITSGKYKIKYECIEAYELRLVDDDDDDILPNMEYPALDDKLNILKSRADILAFVEKINFNPETDMNTLTTNILGSSVRNFQTVLNIKFLLFTRKLL